MKADRPNFRVQAGNWLVHRYGDVWVQCQDEKRRDRCDELVAGLAALLEEARQLIMRGRYDQYGGVSEVIAFLNKTSAPTPEPSMEECAWNAEHDKAMHYYGYSGQPEPSLRPELLSLPEAKYPFFTTNESSYNATLYECVRQHAAAINMIRNVVEQMRPRENDEGTRS